MDVEPLAIQTIGVIDIDDDGVGRCEAWGSDVFTRQIPDGESEAIASTGERSSDTDYTFVGQVQRSKVGDKIVGHAVVHRRVGFACQWGVVRQPINLDAVGRIADISVLNRRATELLLISQTDLGRVGTGGDPRGRIVDIGALGTDPKEVGARCSWKTWEQDTQTRIFRVGCPIFLEQSRGVSTGCRTSPLDDGIDVVRVDRRILEQQRWVGLLGGAIIAPSQQVPIGIEDLDDRIEAHLGVIDVEPNLGSSRSAEAVEVLVGRFAQYTLDGKPKEKILVRGGGIWGQGTEELCREDRVIDSGGDYRSGFGFNRRRDIAIVAERIEEQAAPIPGSWDTCDPIVVRIGLRTTIGLRTCADAIVAKARQNDRETWHTEDLHRTTDAIADAREVTRCDQSCAALLIKVRTLTFHFHHERLVDSALQSESSDLL